MDIRTMPLGDTVVVMAWAGLLVLGIVVVCVLLGDAYDSLQEFQSKRNSEEIE